MMTAEEIEKKVASKEAERTWIQRCIAVFVCPLCGSTVKRGLGEDEIIIYECRCGFCYRQGSAYKKIIQEDIKEAVNKTNDLEDLSMEEALHLLKRDFLQRSLDRHGGSIRKTADALKIQRTYLSRLKANYKLVTK